MSDVAEGVHMDQEIMFKDSWCAHFILSPLDMGSMRCHFNFSNLTYSVECVVWVNKSADVGELSRASSATRAGAKADVIRSVLVGPNVQFTWHSLGSVSIERDPVPMMKCFCPFHHRCPVCFAAVCRARSECMRGRNRNEKNYKYLHDIESLY